MNQVFSLYDDEAKKILRSYNWPKGLVIDVVEYTNPLPHLNIRLYRNNFETFDGVDKEYISKMIGEAIMRVRKLGCACFLEVVAECPIRQ